MKNKSTIILLILLGCCFLSVLAVTFFRFFDADIHLGKRIAVIELNGAIEDSRDIVRQFKKFRDDSSLEAIVFRIDSPGGGITPSQEIFDIVRKTRAAGKPVIVSMGSVAASGGYYVACPADTIVANPGTITGSIGVSIQYPNVDKLLEKVGVKFTTIKSGQFKDALSPFRDMTKQEADYLQSFVMNAYQQFLTAVAQSRNIDTADVRPLADGRVFTGEQALAYGLVDRLGTYDDAIHVAGRMAGLTGEPSIVREEKKRSSIFDFVFNDDAAQKIDQLLPEFRLYPVVSYKYGL